MFQLQISSYNDGCKIKFGPSIVNKKKATSFISKKYILINAPVKHSNFSEIAAQPLSGSTKAFYKIKGSPPTYDFMHNWKNSTAKWIGIIFLCIWRIIHSWSTNEISVNQLKPQNQVLSTICRNNNIFVQKIKLSLTQCYWLYFQVTCFYLRVGNG